jgi:hypothetical protein
MLGDLHHANPGRRLRWSALRWRRPANPGVLRQAAAGLVWNRISAENEGHVVLLIIAKRNDEVERFVFPVQHDLDVPVMLAHAQRMLDEKGWTVLYRTFSFVNCGYDVDESGQLKPLEAT